MDKKLKTPHIDIETLSLRPTACITAISAKTFFFDGTTDDKHSFDFCVDATSCAMYGLTIDQSTVNWWASQSDEAKYYFLNRPAIKLKDALQRLSVLYHDVQQTYGCQRVLVWVQHQAGSDVDQMIWNIKCVTDFMLEAFSPTFATRQ